MADSVVVGTWPFSKTPVATVYNQLRNGETCVEAVRTGIMVAETDPAYGQHLVGVGGARNSEGRLEMDAAIMEGQSLEFGAVLGLQGITSPISVARDVMHHSDHSMLAGDGALTFAKSRGYTLQQDLLAQIPPPPSKSQGMDTLGIVALSNGTVCAGVTTSGKANKHPGRVGDSPLPGSGLYADNKGGAACCTGDGDEILKYCPSFHAVLLMKQGRTAQDACEEVVKDILKRLNTEPCFEFGMIAVDMKGNVGAVGTVSSYTDSPSGVTHPGFPYIVYRDGDDQPKLLVMDASVQR